MKNLITVTILCTLTTAVSAFDLASYNEANGYWGADALTRYEAEYDMGVTTRIARAESGGLFLADYNESNGYNGPDALSRAEAARDRVISRQVDAFMAENILLANYNEANGYAGSDALSYEEMLRDQSVGEQRKSDVSNRVITLRNTMSEEPGSRSVQAYAATDEAGTGVVN